MCNWYQAFHVYGCKIGPDTTVYSWTIKKSAAMPPRPVQGHSRFFFMVCLPLGEGRPVELGRYGRSCGMYVDYVRVYEP